MKLSHLLLAIVACFGIYSIVAGEPALAETVSLATVSVYGFGDALLRQSKALPNGAANVTSDAIDIGTGANIATHEFQVDAPALNATQLPNTQTMTYAVVTSANSDLSSPTVVNASLLVQTGADSAGAAAASATFRLPTDCDRYVGIKATKSGAGDASAASVVLSLKF